MDRLVVRIASEAREIEAALPADLPVAALLPGVVQLCEGRFPSEGEAADWELVTESGEGVDPGATLRQVGFEEGALLRLVRRQPVGAWAGPPAAMGEAGAAASVAAPESRPDAEAAPAGGPMGEAGEAEGGDGGAEAAAEPATELPSAVPLGDRLKAVAG